MNIDEKRVWIFGVAKACPLTNELESCPFSEMRKTPVSECWKTISAMPEEQIDILIDHHSNCLYNRELKKCGGGKTGC